MELSNMSVIQVDSTKFIYNTFKSILKGSAKAATKGPAKGSAKAEEAIDKASSSARRAHLNCYYSFFFAARVINYYNTVARAICFYTLVFTAGYSITYNLRATSSNINLNVQVQLLRRDRVVLRHKDYKGRIYRLFRNPRRIHT